MCRLRRTPACPRFRRDERAASIVEYALLLALLTLVVLGAMSLLGNQISGFFTSLASMV
jgi:pilus assembly protein Flp/PilA